MATESREPADANEVYQMYQQMMQEINAIWSKINELDSEKHEHELVLEAINGFDASRRCFRLIGGVLVERTVGEVAPAVQRNKEGLEEVISRLEQQLEDKKKQVKDLQDRYNIQMKAHPAEGKQQQQQQEGSQQQGLLVGNPSEQS